MKKERKLDRVYAEFDKEYSNESEENMNKIIESLEKEIDGKTKALETKNVEEKEELQKDIDSKKQRLQNLKGYTKNKKQIVAIKEYQKSLQDKLAKVVKDKEKSSVALKKARAELDKVNKRLANEKNTMKLDNNEYNELLEKREKFSKEVELQSKQYLHACERIQDLNTKISKCNLAWRTLFVNKDWDEIQRIATSPNERYTRKIDEENMPIGSKGKINMQKAVEEETQKVQEEIGEKVSKIKEEGDAERVLDTEEVEITKNESKEAKSKALVERKEGLFRKMLNKLKSLFNGKNKEKEEKQPKKMQQKTQVEPEKLSKKERDAYLEGYLEGILKQQSQEETKTSSEVKQQKETKTSSNQERDDFLEGLRKHVDPDYAKAVKTQKEAQEIEAHKIQSGTTNQQNNDEQEIGE